MRTCVSSVMSGLSAQPTKALKPQSPLRGGGPHGEGLDTVISILCSELLEGRRTQWAQTVLAGGPPSAVSP